MSWNSYVRKLSYTQQCNEMEAGVLRKLHANLDLIDPEVAEDLYADSLLTRRDKEKIDAETVPSKKAALILSILGRRKPKKALEGLIKSWEKDKEQNEEILTKLSQGKRRCHGNRTTALNRDRSLSTLQCILATDSTRIRKPLRVSVVY